MKDLDIMARKKNIVLHDKNPFVTNMTNLTTRKKRTTVKGGKIVVDSSTGEFEDVAEIVSVHKVDNAQFVKVFTSNLKQFFNLKPTTYKMVQVLLYQLGSSKDRDTVYLNISIAEQYFTETEQQGVSKPSYYNAVRELIEKQFIAESIHPNLYFINPSLFFNGDRVRFVNEYRNIESRPEVFPLDDTDQTIEPSIVSQIAGKVD